MFGYWLHQLQAGCSWASSLPFLGLITEAYTHPRAVEMTKDEAYKTLSTCLTRYTDELLNLPSDMAELGSGSGRKFLISL